MFAYATGVAILFTLSINAIVGNAFADVEKVEFAQLRRVDYTVGRLIVLPFS